MATADAYIVRSVRSMYYIRCLRKVLHSHGYPRGYRDSGPELRNPGDSEVIVFFYKNLN